MGDDARRRSVRGEAGGDVILRHGGARGDRVGGDRECGKIVEEDILLFGSRRSLMVKLSVYCAAASIGPEVVPSPSPSPGPSQIPYIRYLSVY